MCAVTVKFDREGDFDSIRTTYCNDHPACCTLRGEFDRPLARAPVTAPTASGVGLRTGSRLFPNRPLSHHGGPRLPDPPSPGPGSRESPEREARESPLRRAASGASALRQKLAKLTSMLDLTARSPYVPFARSFCIRIFFAYNCGHAVDMKPPIHGWLCSKEGCLHWKRSHYIAVPLQFPCSWTTPCDSKEPIRKTVLAEVEKRGGKPKIVLREPPSGH